MSSLTRMLSVLDLFSREHTALTANQIAEKLDLSRGKAAPTFRSGSSKVILAHLKPAHLKRIWATHQGEPDVQAMCSDWKRFRAYLQVIKVHGYWVSHGEIEPGVVGIAAPVLFANGEVPAA